MRIIMLGMLAATVLPTDVGAQSPWRLTGEIGKATYSWAVRDTGADPVTVRPWHPSVWSLRLTREHGRLGIGIAAGVALGQEGGMIAGVAILPGSNLNLMEFAPEARWLIHRTANGAELHLHGGPLLDIWWPSGADPRTRFGGQGGAEFLIPFAERWAVTLRGDGAISGSYVTKEEAGNAFRRPSSMRRVRFGIGVTRRL